MSLFALLVLLVVCPYSHAAIVGYVPTDACATEAGCDFNSAIWNISGVPSATDDVYIISDVNIKIYVNTSTIWLSSLHLGDPSMRENVTFIILSSELTLNTGNWYNSAVIVRYGTLNINGFVQAGYLHLDYGVLNAQDVSILNLLSTYSHLEGTGTWFTSYGQLDFSEIIAFTVSFGNLLSVGTNWTINTNFTLLASALIQDGNFSVASYAILQLGSADLEFFNTWANIGQVSANGAELSFASYYDYNTLTIQTTNSVTCPLCPTNLTLFLDDHVTANLYSGTIPYLILGTSVTVNFMDSPFSGDRVQLYDIRPLDETPAQFNIYTVVELNSPTAIVANVQVVKSSLEYVALHIYSNVEIVGSITGTGDVGFYGGSLTVSSISVHEVHSGYNTSTLTTTDQPLNVSNIICWGGAPFAESGSSHNFESQLLIQSGAVVGYELETTGGYVFVNGGYAQNNGIIFFMPGHTVLEVNGSVGLYNVTFLGTVQVADLINNKLVLVRSLTKSMDIKLVDFENFADGVNVNLTVRDGELFLEVPHSNSNSNDEEGQRRVAIGLGVGLPIMLLIVIAFIIVWQKRSRAAKRRQYQTIAATVNSAANSVL